MKTASNGKSVSLCLYSCCCSSACNLSTWRPPGIVIIAKHVTQPRSVSCAVQPSYATELTATRSQAVQLSYRPQFPRTPHTSSSRIPIALFKAYHHTPNARKSTHQPTTMESNRLFHKFPTPAWVNNANVRTGGVYLSGAMVSHLLPHVAPTNTTRSSRWASSSSSTPPSSPTPPLTAQQFTSRSLTGSRSSAARWA